MRHRLSCFLVAAGLAIHAEGRAASSIDFGRQIRPILSENCFFCHGPDENKREAGLRLDVEAAAKSNNDGVIAIVPGEPEKSALFQRIISTDPDDVMPPPKQHKTIPAEQIELLSQWITEGAQWGNHWSYEPVTRPEDPSVRLENWKASTNPIDAFLGQRLAKEDIQPTPPASAAVLVRRIALDLTGLPPTLEELERWVQVVHQDPRSVIDHFLAKPAYGEHWARQWLDLARYADSSGYPSDQPREIWAYRDWVIEAFNANMPFDQFTIEQMAGDLLPGPSDDQLIATAFHRNTMTQNEGGTSDEEFRTAAVVDRVNTTMAIWMGTTMACAQCHTHKYDPITQHEYYQFYDFLNQTADADKRDESPVHAFHTREQKTLRSQLNRRLATLNAVFEKPDPAIFQNLPDWENELPIRDGWTTITPKKVTGLGKTQFSISKQGQIDVTPSGGKIDTYTATLPLQPGDLAALRVDALPSPKQIRNTGPDFVITSLRADLVPATARPKKGRFLRIEKISDRYDVLALAEVEVYSGFNNIAPQGVARQVSTFVGQPEDKAEASLAIDGNTDGRSVKEKSVSLTGGGDDQWWELDLKSERSVDRLVIYGRTDKGPGATVEALRLSLLDDDRKVVWSTEHRKERFAAREAITVSGRHEVTFAKAFADESAPDLNASAVIAAKPNKAKGWGISDLTEEHRLTLLTDSMIKIEKPSHLVVQLAQNYGDKIRHTLGTFRLAVADRPDVERLSQIPGDVLAALAQPVSKRTAAQTATVRSYYARHVAPSLAKEREEADRIIKQLKDIKMSTVPVMAELPAEERRTTQVQLRGDWQSLGDKVLAATPAAFHPLPKEAKRDRLNLAKWLVDRDNPLTARVIANRLWESIFGIGIVATSEEFGSQGDLPFHPELLDWLAAELMDSGWDLQHLLRLILTSEAYQQDSRVTPALLARDPDNRLVARGPRFRPTGEMLRDQALAVSGLLSSKMGGPAVRPPAPKSGLKSAFGRAHDWVVSPGEDRYRRSIYTEVRRNSPYASFMAFDGVNREVCTVRRNRTNTPLQAFVTLNDPVFIEANQAMARRLLREGGDTTASRLTLAFQLCVAREPSAKETAMLTRLFNDSLQQFQQDEEAATKMATDPLGPALEGASVVELAAWTAVANVVMNLDEFLMRR